MPAKSRPGYIEEIVSNFDKLPDSAIVPTLAVARLHSTSNRTVRRCYPMVRISPGRVGVRVGDVRAKAPPPNTA